MDTDLVCCMKRISSSSSCSSICLSLAFLCSVVVMNSSRLMPVESVYSSLLESEAARSVRLRFRLRLRLRLRRRLRFVRSVRQSDPNKRVLAAYLWTATSLRIRCESCLVAAASLASASSISCRHRRTSRDSAPAPSISLEGSKRRKSIPSNRSKAHQN